MVKTQNHKRTTMNKTKKQCPKNCQTLTTFHSFEKEYEKGIKNTLVKSHRNIEKELIKMFQVPYAPHKISAKSDYYSFINYRWIEEKVKELEKKSNYFVQLDSFRVIQDKVYHEIIDLVKNYIKTNNTPKAKQLKNFYDALEELDDESSRLAIDETISIVDKSIMSNNIYSLIGNINQNEMVSWGSPIGWNVFKDEKNSKVYRSHISPPQLTLYDYTLYIDVMKRDHEGKKYQQLVKRKYLKFIDEMFDACLGKNHGLKSIDVWDCEYDMLLAMGCDTIKNEDENGYNIVHKNESIKICGLNWEEFSHQIGYKSVPDKYICGNRNYVKCILETLNTDNAWQSDKWRTYYLYIHFRQIMRFNKKWRHIHYEFFSKFIQGVPTPIPIAIYPIDGLSIAFPSLLATEYINKFKHQERIDYVLNMCTDLLTVFKRIIKRNDWLSPITKKHALKKLENIKLIVGAPDEIRSDPHLEYSNKKAYHNLITVCHDRTKKLINLDGNASAESFPLIDWKQFKLIGKQPYIVNAFYTPTENSIYVPLGYLQKPFIDLESRGIEYNLAYIGYTLGHEMSHSLDDTGSKYDYKGNLNNWWTAADKKKFNLKVKGVIKQYEQFASYDGIKMDASLSTGEDLADISGLKICEEYLRDFQDKNHEPMPLRLESFKTFFIYIAIQSRQKIYDAAIKSQLKINPHPMNKYRTNCPLARLELFKSIYNIKKGDKMYWSNNDTIW